MYFNYVLFSITYVFLLYFGSHLQLGQCPV